MKTTHLITILATSAALATVASPAAGQTYDDISFDGMMKMPMMDTNKDGMVSKKEFLDMMGKMWDARAKKMNVKGDKMTAEDFKQILMYLKAGG